MGASPLKILRRFLNNPAADLSFLEKGLASHSLERDRPSQRALVRRLAASYGHAKREQEKAPLPYQPGGEWKRDIETRRADYLKALRDQDFSTLESSLENFFRNSGSAGLLAYGYYRDIRGASALKKRWFVNCILQDVATWKNVTDQPDIGRLSAPWIGNPWGYWMEGHLITPVSCRHEYYARRVDDLLANVEFPVVAEIGGGFGGLAYHLLSSPRPIKYINFDLPEVLLIAQYYLLSAFPKKRALLFGERAGKDLTRDVLEEYDILLMPNFQLSELAPGSVDLVINTGSLSEMDYATIEEYLAQIRRTCTSYFIHENSDREVHKEFGHVEVPSSKFPIPREAFQRIYRFPSLWGGSDGRYWEYLYQRIVGAEPPECS